MGSHIDLDLFDYVDEYAAEIAAGERKGTEDFDPEWDIFTFCQLFFDQFFARYQTNISGFTQRSRETAVTLVEKLREQGSETAAGRRIIVLYEEFCDMTEYSNGRYGTTVSMDVVAFHDDHLSRLLEAAHEWAETEMRPDLYQRIGEALEAYQKAIEGIR